MIKNDNESFLSCLGRKSHQQKGLVRVYSEEKKDKMRFIYEEKMLVRLAVFINY